MCESAVVISYCGGATSSFLPAAFLIGLAVAEGEGARAPVTLPGRSGRSASPRVDSRESGLFVPSSLTVGGTDFLAPAGGEDGLLPGLGVGLGLDLEDGLDLAFGFPSLPPLTPPDLPSAAVGAGAGAASVVMTIGASGSGSGFAVTVVVRLCSRRYRATSTPVNANKLRHSTLGLNQCSYTHIIKQQTALYKRSPNKHRPRIYRADTF